MSERAKENQDALEEVYEDKKAFAKREAFAKRIFICVCICLVAIVVAAVRDSSLRFNESVFTFSDEAPRVGNNVYGYIDVPEGFVMKGSFNPEDANYVGGEDGIAEGVQLKNEDGTMYIIVSLLTSDKRRADYVGLGDGRHISYSKRKTARDADGALSIITDELLASEVIGRGDNGLIMEATPIDVNNLTAMSAKWIGKRGDRDYQYQTYIVENPDKKGVFHCLTAVFTTGNEQCVNCLQTFSFSRDEASEKRFVGIEDRVGSKSTGYMNIPKGFREYEAVWYYEIMDDLQTDADLKLFAPEECYNQDKAMFECIALVGFEKSKKYDENFQEYMQMNLAETYGYLGLYDYADMSNVTLQDASKEFGADAFLSVMQQTLGENGVLESEPAIVDGNTGYRVTWHGRGTVDRSEMYLSFYILESAQNADVVYVMGAKERTADGQFWQYLDSFKANDKAMQSTQNSMTE